MARFDDCLAIVLGNEGGVSNNPNDNGGLTNMGVTQTVYDAYRARYGLPPQVVNLITQSEASAIYLTNYWIPVKAPSLTPPVDLCVFDAAVNSGVYRACRLLQQCVGTTQDGVIGSKTLAAADQIGPLTLASDYCAARETFVRGIVTNDPTQRVFLAGWLNRINRIRHICGVGA